MSPVSDVLRNASDGVGSVDRGGAGVRPGHRVGDEREHRWESICRLERLEPGRGSAALLAGAQVALFRLAAAVGEDNAPTVYVIDNIDPFSGAAVLSRGIVGDRSGEPVVASPVYKQAFSLRTGRCLDDPEREVPVYQARVVDGWVQVELP